MPEDRLERLERMVGQVVEAVSNGTGKSRIETLDGKVDKLTVEVSTALATLTERSNGHQKQIDALEARAQKVSAGTGGASGGVAGVLGGLLAAWFKGEGGP